MVSPLLFHKGRASLKPHVQVSFFGCTKVTDYSSLILYTCSGWWSPQRECEKCLYPPVQVVLHCWDALVLGNRLFQLDSIHLQWWYHTTLPWSPQREYEKCLHPPVQVVLLGCTSLQAIPAWFYTPAVMVSPYSSTEGVWDLKGAWSDQKKNHLPLF